MFSGKRQWSILILSLLVFVGCSRPASDSSKVQLVIPLAEALKKSNAQAISADDSLGHVIINVTGSGFSPILFTWSACHECATSTAPSSFTLDIPSGSDRLIQVLAVYKNSTTQAMSFYYGDTTASLTSTSESVNVSISPLGGASAVVSGQISGRYLSAANQGPTGPVDIIYTPAGKPSLIIERSWIVNGWFNFFGLAGMAFGYRLPDGTLLFGKNLDLNDPDLAASHKTLRVGIPSHYRKQDHGGTITWERDEANLEIYGYFGPGADATYNVCRPATLGTLTKLAKITANPGDTALTYTAGPIPAPATLLSTSTPLSSYYSEGGLSTGACASPTAANHYVSYLKFDPSYIDGNGRDGAAGFEMPFAWNAQSKGISVDTSNPRILSGTALPGVELVYDKVDAFKRLSSNDDYHLENFTCQEIAAGGKEFISAGPEASINPTTRVFSLTSNITSAEATSGVSVVICPKKNGVYAPTGRFVQSWQFKNFNGGGGGLPMATKVAITGPSKIAHGVCTPVNIVGQTADGSPAQLPMNATGNFTTSDGNLQFLDNEYCNQNVSPNRPLNTRLYLYNTGAGIQTKTLTVTASNSLGTANFTANLIDPPSTPSLKLKTVAPSTINPYECYPVQFETWSDDGTTAVPIVVATDYSFTMSSTPNLSFHTNPNCLYTPSTSVYFSSSTAQSQSQLYMKYTGSSTSISIAPSSSAFTAAGGSFTGNTTLSVNSVGAPAKLSFMTNSTTQEGQCLNVTVRLEDSNGRLTGATTPFTAVLSSNIAGNFSQDGCMSANPNVSFSVGDAAKLVYFKPLATGAYILTANSSSPAYTGTMSLTVGAATFTSFLAVFPGQSFVPGTGITGSALPVAHGSTIGIQLYALKYDLTVDTSANGALLGSLIATGAVSSPPANSVNFASGLASLNLTSQTATSSLSVSVNAQTPNGPASGGGSTTAYQPASYLNIYGPAGATLFPNSCQLLTVVPETAGSASPGGYASVAVPKTYTLSVDSGGLYTNSSCTTPFGGSATMNPNERMHVYFFKAPSGAGTSNISIASSLASTPLSTTTTASGAVGSASGYRFVGRSADLYYPSSSSMCQPYAVVLIDSATNYVHQAADTGLTLTVNSGGGTVGAFTNSTCQSPWVNSGSIIGTTNIGAGYFDVYLAAGSSSGAVNILSVSGAYTGATLNVTSYPMP